MKENVFSLKKKKKKKKKKHNEEKKREREKEREARSRQYPTETITNADYADNLALLANTPAQAKSLLHKLKSLHELRVREF